MNSRELLITFVSKNRYYLLFAAGLIFVLVNSLSTLTTKPRLWTDEAVSIEIARNFQTDGVLDVKIAPEIFSGFGERLQSTGYPVTIPLSVFFTVFGYGFIQARIYMLLWMLALLCALYYVGKGWFGERNSLLAFFLVITFASFYANGRTVVGEIPGFLFLLFGFYFLFNKKKFITAGLCLGFAVVSKLSVFGLIIPTLVVAYTIEWRNFFKVLVPVAVGMLPAGIAWILLNIYEPFSVSTWANLFGFYKNPYSSSVSENVAHNIAGMMSSTTLLYFGILFVTIVVALFVLERRHRTLFNFTVIYSILAFIYYLRSPGWLRYLLIAEFFILLVLPYALSEIAKKVREKYPTFVFAKEEVFVCALVCLIVLQFFQMFYKSEIFAGNGALLVSDSINHNFPDKSVGILNAIEVGILVDTDKRYLSMELTGVPQIGYNPLLLRNPPELIVSHPDNKFLLEGLEIVKSEYQLFDTVGGYEIYERK